MNREKARECVRSLIPDKWSERRGESLKDFPGMANVCLYHAMAWRDAADTTWREGGHSDCICELVEDAKERLKAQIAWARQDEELARMRAEQLEEELRNLPQRS